MNERSKKLSQLLRHRPGDLAIDKEGWVPLNDLLAKTDFTWSELDEIVKSDSKKRYTMTSEKIRANQGHSTDKVELKLPSTIPPTILYHGTKNKHLKEIRKTGLLPMKRQYVHLSADLETAGEVGDRRKGDTTILEIDCKAMLANGHVFFLSDNNVWLAYSVPAKYLKEHK